MNQQKYPTREQIAAAEALQAAIDRDAGFGQTTLVATFDLATVLALFPQPTPNAEEQNVECPRCKGYGVDPSVQRPGDMVVDCRRCSGSGEVSRG